jgi:hypothetical protein
MSGYLSKKGVYISATDIGTESSPTYTGLTLSGLTASTVIYADASKAIASLANGSGYLLNDGSGGLSWAAVSLSGYLKADGTVPLTADWNVGAFDLTALNLTASPALSVEQITNFAGWTAAAGWTYGAGTGWTHSSGTTAETATGETALVRGTQYKVVVAYTHAGTGGVTFSMGGQTFAQETSATSATYYVTCTATTTSYRFTPSTAWTGSITSVSVNIVTDGLVTSNGMVLNGGNILLSSGNLYSPAISFSSEPMIGWYFDPYNSRQSFTFRSGSTPYDMFGINISGVSLLSSTVAYSWRTNITRLFSDADYQLDQRNGVNPQKYNFYGTYTSATNYERGFMRSTASAVEIGSEKGSGGGTARPVGIFTDGIERVTIDTSGNVAHVGLNAQATNIKQATIVVTTTAAATVTATNLIPAGSMVVGVTCRNTTAVTGDAGFTGYNIGDGSDPDRWGANVDPAINETTDLTDCTITSVPLYAAATSVVLTQVGGSTFVADKTIRITVHYISLTAPST